MSRDAFSDYRSERTEQLTRNEARNIRKMVDAAQRDRPDAGRRWPFELVQNAIDAGARDGNVQVDVSLSWNNQAILFEHNGAPFSLRELAALLSGGSSKEYDSEETTGRFGTGFLATHVLAPQTRVSGHLRTKTGLERFELTLDRTGDEDAIFNNIQGCDQAICDAAPISQAGTEVSARFEYFASTHDALHAGIEAFRDALPYLFATCPILGRVNVRRTDGSTETWTPGDTRHYFHATARIDDRLVTLEGHGPGGRQTGYRSVRISNRQDQASAVLVVEDVGSAWRVCLPQDKLGRVFRRFPIRTSYSLPINLILDAPLDVDPERRHVSLETRNRQLLNSALTSIASAVGLASAEGWPGWHLLAEVGTVPAVFADEPEERSWWQEELRKVAGKLASMPLVETQLGRLPAKTPESTPAADFPVPRLAGAVGEDETALDRVWPLIELAPGMHPPIQSLADDWLRIARKWNGLGIPLSLVTLHDLAEAVKEGASTVGDLRVTGEPRQWLVRFVDVVHDCWTKRGLETGLLDGLLPDQIGSLRSTKELSRDGGIPDLLKDIAESVGLSARARLLDAQLREVARQLGIDRFASAVAKAIPGELSESDLTKDCLQALQTKLKEEVCLSEDNENLVKGSIRFLDYLWRTHGPKAREMATEVPLLSSDDTIVRWGPKRIMMAPVISWPEAARQFYEAYPAKRVLAAVYCGTEAETLPNVVPPLIAWRIAIGDPLISHNLTCTRVNGGAFSGIGRDRPGYARGDRERSRV